MRGKTIYIELATLDDAEFILSLRNNSELNKHLSKTSADISSQRQWLSDYKKREDEKKEYYFIINRLDGVPIGTVRLYDFLNERNSFCWGSWILNIDKTRTSAIESALLVYEFAFKHLDFENCHFDVRKDNKSVIRFHEKLGAKIVSETEFDYYFEYSKPCYNAFFKENKKFIEYL
ncbi:GNAT family N-acetyltransferase [Vibrio splendidus]|uniref:GNAT family N-acetyltransferase n=1 Tax=Vibrio splendidus TaxID=29497 RepID=UPI000E093A6B|nr:GNAT family N-acetyltransferase [Vibrio splendidus]